ncbi:MAG: tetratricopeptide repeat protein [Atribacterota bacterium]|nr:tetratricopeptide repeat protein [Atribacterota bacterium]
MKMKLNKTIYYTMMLLLLFTVSQIFILSGFAQQLQISSNTQPQAVDYLQRAVNKMQEALDTYQGANYPGRKLWIEAIDYAQKALYIDQNFIEANYYLALMYQYTNWYYREAEQWEKYLDLIKGTDLTSTSLQVQQNLAHAYYRLGSNSYQKGDYEQSLTYFLNSIKEYPGLIDSNYWAARVFYETGDLEKSLFYWERVLNLDPNYPRAQYFYDKIEASIKYGKQAYNLYEQGYNYYESKNFKQAIDSYREAIRLNPRFAEAYYWQARVYFETGDYQQAIQNYRKVLEIEPDNAKAKYWLKESQRQLGAKQ